MGLLIVGFDGSPPSRRAVELASRRAIASGDELLLLTVIPPQVSESDLSRMLPAAISLPAEMRRPFHENAQARLDELAEELRKAGAKVRVELRMGDPASEFRALTGEAQATEIVIGHKSFQGAHLQLGPNAQRILQAATVPVTLVP